MKLLRILSLCLCLLSSGLLCAQDGPRDTSATTSARKFPKLDKRRLTRLKKLIRKKKTSKIKKEKRKSRKLIAASSKNRKRQVQRRRRLRLLKLAQDRLKAGTIDGQN